MNALDLRPFVIDLKSKFNDVRRGIRPNFQNVDWAAFPSIPLLAQGAKTRQGIKAINSIAQMNEARLMEMYRKILPAVLRSMYQVIKQRDVIDEENPNGMFSCLVGAFSQAVFDAGLMPYNKRHSLSKLMDVLEEVDSSSFAEVQKTIFHAAISELAIIAVDSNLPLDDFSSTAELTNCILQPRIHSYALEILNALELSGYELDDPQILGSLRNELKNSLAIK